jgi:hypothetical protein
MKLRMMRGTIVPRVAIHPGAKIATWSAITVSGMFDVTDVERSGLSDCTSHPYPENHTQREP